MNNKNSSGTPEHSFIVGRQAEIQLFAALTSGQTSYRLLNIYGPGGIGKTVVGQKMRDYATHNRIPFAFIDGIQNLTPKQMLQHIAQGFMVYETFTDTFSSFNQQMNDYLLIQEVMQTGGGLQTMFNAVGAPQNAEMMEQVFTSLGSSMSQATKQIISSRFALERYLRRVEKTLTDTLIDALKTAVSLHHLPLTLVIDTYEQMEEYDDWFCQQFFPIMPDNIQWVILGRNSLSRLNFEWNEAGDKLHTMSLPELPPPEAKAYLRHYGLHDPVALEQVVRFTGGYPLLLVLVVHLAREVGGWQQIGLLEFEANRDRVARQLLERILREERAKEVQVFLEKGAVADWFTPEIVSIILNISLSESRTLYDKLDRHSFIERHPSGLKFHDKIRELLRERLKFTDSAEYDRLVNRLKQYHKTEAEKGESTPPTTSYSHPTKKERTFGQWLSYYRLHCKDPQTGKFLTQKQLADHLAAEPEGRVFSNAIISYWENNHIIISQTDRTLLLLIIRVLHRYGGLQTPQEADTMLSDGGYRPLNTEEKQSIFGYV